MAKPERLSPALLIVGNTTVPLAPSTLAVTGRTTTTVGLSWVAPLSNGGSALTDYTIEYSSNGGATYTAFAHGASTVAAITVTGLVKGTAYLFRVAAVSAIGTGPVSDPVARTTDSEPGAPTGLEVTAFTDTTVGLAWVAPANDGGRAISDYLIEVSDDDGGSYTPFAHGASAAVAITVTGLTAETTYLFRVSAINSVGTGPASGTVEQTTAAGSFADLQALRSGEWGLGEAAATDNFADSVGPRNVTQTGNPGVGGTYRTFNGLTQWGSRDTTGDDVLGCVGLPYAVSCNFRTPAALGVATRQIVGLREAGSASGNLAFLIRREAADLVLYFGHGSGNLLNSTIVATLAPLTTYHFIFRVNDIATGSIDYSLNGAALTPWNAGLTGTTVNHGLTWNIGGDTLELWDDRIYRVRLFWSTVPDDAQMHDDFLDPLGV